MTDDSDQTIDYLGQIKKVLTERPNEFVLGQHPEYPKIIEFTKQAIEVGGIEALTILNEGLVPAFDVLSNQLNKNYIYFPEILISGQLSKKIMEVLEPYLVESGHEPEHTYLIGTVQGDLHDIGKNLVAGMLRGYGWKVVDLGIDVHIEKFVETIRNNNQVDIVGISSLLTTTMPAMEKTVKAIKDSRLDVKIMIGGAPITQSYADKIGADGYAENAGLVVKAANKLLGK